jgi:hypothetical protein
MGRLPLELQLMQYYVGSNGKIDGPLSIGEINTRIAAKSLAAGTLANCRLETKEDIAKAPERDWLFLAEIPGVTGLPRPARDRGANEPNTWFIGCMFFAICFVLVVIVALVLF